MGLGEITGFPFSDLIRSTEVNTPEPQFSNSQSGKAPRSPNSCHEHQDKARTGTRLGAQRALTTSIKMTRAGDSDRLLLPMRKRGPRPPASPAHRALVRPHACACSTGTRAGAGGEGAGPPQRACAVRGCAPRGRGCAGAPGAPVLERKQERGRDEAAVDARATSGGERGGERGPAPTLSSPELPSSARVPGRAHPPRAHHEPGESERRGRRQPAALRQLQPGRHVRTGVGGVGGRGRAWGPRAGERGGVPRACGRAAGRGEGGRSPRGRSGSALAPRSLGGQDDGDGEVLHPPRGGFLFSGLTSRGVGGRTLGPDLLSQSLLGRWE